MKMLCRIFIGCQEISSRANILADVINALPNFVQSLSEKDINNINYQNRLKGSNMYRLNDPEGTELFSFTALVLLLLQSNVKLPQ